MDSEFYKSVYNCFFIQKKGNSNVSETKEKWEKCIKGVPQPISLLKLNMSIYSWFYYCKLNKICLKTKCCSQTRQGQVK